jgi:hypothetical protein
MIRTRRTTSFSPATPHEVLAAGLREYFGRPVNIAAINCEPLAWKSTHPIDRLRVRLTSGERLAVIFKQLRRARLSRGGHREVMVYRRVLAGGRFGAPALYASVLDSGGPRYWLFLEDVGGAHVGQSEMPAWFAAVRWLAKMHAAYLGRDAELRALGCLGTHGIPYYQRIRETARRHLERAGVRQCLQRFDQVMQPFSDEVAWLIAQPRTLVHGDIFPENLIVQEESRIRPVDWESAAIGLGAWDLARLLDGWGADRVDFIAAYLAELDCLDASPTDMQAFRRIFHRSCRVLNALWHLGWSLEPCRDPAFVMPLLNEIEASWQHQ